MPSTFIFGCLKLKTRFCEIPFPKSIIYSDVVLSKLGHSYESSFPSQNSESWTPKCADGHFHCWQSFPKFSRPLITRSLVHKELKNVCPWNNFKKNKKVIRWPYKILLKSLTGQTNLRLTDFPYYDQRKIQETKRITIGCVFVCQFMVHSMICMSGHPG